ncbi:MAG: 16S rRNA (adenine(1518)-N(6)/adenine(1519)-N(6))-dimethyltransferase RsmA [Dysgonamonadaceae bacterium]|jgi:16S rRNA (adenine1518-N6/adenine1519-N6)-dimethyltransferase|nr:16S rRNA (adenine(1518)-N(6)/adenine(1519)-N(6))-dimethyltransferase RsmA [Dysgonamonadaceae bacterium]
MYHRRIQPKKSLGQHFLKDFSIAEKIAAVLPSDTGLPTLEVGAGTGILTRFLIKTQKDLTVVELDKTSVAYLASHYPELKGRIIEADFLTLDLTSLFPSQQFMITGNYPYNISSQILFKVLEHRDLIPLCAGMLQKEVAERIASKQGTRTSGIITILLQAWYDVEYLFTVEPDAFDPPPKVRSAVIRMKRNSRTTLGCSESHFRTVVKTAFNQRRKTLRNSLSAHIALKPEVTANLIFNLRPEQLSVEQFIELTNILK